MAATPSEILAQFDRVRPGEIKAEADLSPEEISVITEYVLKRAPLTSEEAASIVPHLTKGQAIELLKTLRVGSNDLILVIEDQGVAANGLPKYGWRQNVNKTGQPRWLINFNGEVQGGMADVLPAFNLHLSTRQALKRVSKAFGRGPERDEHLQKLQREGEVHAASEGHGVVTIYDRISLPDQIMLVMRYMDPEVFPTLSNVMNDPNTLHTQERLRGKVVFSPERIIRFVDNLAISLSRMHEADIVHLDLKPSNIFISEQGDLVTDFGLSNKVTDPSESFGTPRYMAPEQVMGEKVDGRSDLYSLSLIVYEMMTGTSLVWGIDPLTLALDQVELINNQRRIRLSQDLERYCQHYHLHHETVVQFFEKTLTHKEDRPANVAEYQELLRTALTPQPFIH